MLFLCALNKIASSEEAALNNQEAMIKYSLPKGAKHGFTINKYDTESFSKPLRNWVSESVDLKMKDLYNSYQVIGSFCPNETGKYQFKADGKTFVSLKVAGKEYSPTTLQGGNCWKSDKETKETPELELYAHRCYSVDVRLVTGCSLYNQWLKISMKKNGGAWELANNMISIKHNDCLPNYYGSKCENYATNTCSGKGKPNTGINGDGKCICDKHYYGESCSDFCSPALTCNYHGTCNGEGKCQCLPPWTGDDCSQKNGTSNYNEIEETTSTGDAQRSGKFDSNEGSNSANLIIIISAAAACVVVIVVILVIRKVQKKDSDSNDLTEEMIKDEESQEDNNNESQEDNSNESQEDNLDESQEDNSNESQEDNLVESQEDNLVESQEDNLVESQEDNSEESQEEI